MNMRLPLMTVGLVAAATVIATPVWAAKKPPAKATTTTPATPATPAGAPSAATVVATVDGHPIHLGDLDAAVQELPQQARAMPAQQLYPILVDQLVDREALVLAARKQGLDKDPAVQALMARADDQVLQNALLRRDIAPQINETNLRAMYDKEIGSKPGEQEVQASHILVPTEAQAKDIIAQLNKGADFATLAKKYSTDPTGAQNGGDLGYFKKGDMLPEFSNAAFAMKPGQITQTPVHTRYGYHVIKVFNTRLSSPPSFAASQQQLQQEMVQNLVQQEVAKAKQGVVIQRFNSDGSPATSTPAVIAPPGSPAAPAAPASPAAPAKK
jgi:peptidyl-prolyl cis-trans isomerase C